MVTLPQRKVRFYEAVTRLRDDKDQILAADDFIAIAEAGGLIGRDRSHGDAALCPGAAPPDGAQQGRRRVLQRLGGDARQSRQFRAMPRLPRGQPRAGAVLRARIQAGDVPQARPDRDRDISRPCRSAATASRSITSPICGSSRATSPTAASASSRCRRRCCSIPGRASTSDIHPSDLSDLLGRFGIDLIAEKIEGERAVVDLLDYDVRFGQGFLFAPPRPLRPEGASATGGADREQGVRHSQWLRQDRFPSTARPSSPRCGRPAMPRWRAAPRGRADRLPQS